MTLYVISVFHLFIVCQFKNVDTYSLSLHVFLICLSISVLGAVHLRSLQACFNLRLLFVR